MDRGSALFRFSLWLPSMLQKGVVIFLAITIAMQILDILDEVHVDRPQDDVVPNRPRLSPVPRLRANPCVEEQPAPLYQTHQPIGGRHFTQAAGCLEKGQLAAEFTGIMIAPAQVGCGGPMETELNNGTIEKAYARWAPIYDLSSERSSRTPGAPRRCGGTHRWPHSRGRGRHRYIAARLCSAPPSRRSRPLRANVAQGKGTSP